MNFISCCEFQCHRCGYCDRFLSPGSYQEEERMIKEAELGGGQEEILETGLRKTQDGSDELSS